MPARPLDRVRIEDVPVDRDRAQPAEAAAFEDCLVGADRVLARRHNDDEAADDERDDRSQDRRDDPARALVEGKPSRDAGNGPWIGRRRGRDGLLAHAATSAPRPPVIAIPSCSSLTSGPYSAAMRPSYMTRMRS